MALRLTHYALRITKYATRVPLLTDPPRAFREWAACGIMAATAGAHGPTMRGGPPDPFLIARCTTKRGDKAMGSLDLWGAIAASVLVAQCLVFNLVWVVLALALWKGSEWIHRHAASGLAKVGGWLTTGQRQVQRGEQYVAAPFVRLRARSAGLRAAWQRAKEG